MSGEEAFPLATKPVDGASSFGDHVVANGGATPSKTCEQCDTVRTLSTFARSADSEDGRVAVCRICTG